MKPTTAQHTTIPAQPGWMHCTPVLDFDGVRVIDIHEAPVIAWVVTICTDESNDLVRRSAQAVVADSPILTQKTRYLKRPDGLYVSPGRPSYETRADLIAGMERVRSAARPKESEQVE